LFRHEEQTQLVAFGGMRYPKDGSTDIDDAEWLSDLYLLDLGTHSLSLFLQ
jgi:hypothetical protein